MVSAVVYDNPQLLTAAEKVDEDIASLPVITRNDISVKNITVNGNPAIQTTGYPSQMGTLDVTLTIGEHSYVLVLTPYSADSSPIAQERIEILELILSTFTVE